ncbi:MAG: hypothetical protein K9K81_00180 [Desulfobacteraceae bacterium]|nr:hypothetical protein [Desulfobacteraceae bacterium]
MEPDGKYAVITGDFIGFSGMDARVRRSMPGLMDKAGKAFCCLMPGVMPYAISVFRGDSWQALFSDPSCALRAAVFIRAYIRAFGGHPGFDTRMAIGIGEVDYVPEKQVTAGDGTAFRRSGKMLRKMGSPRAGNLRYAFDNVPFEAVIDALVRATGALMETWRPLQARAVISRLEGLKIAQIADDWPGPVSPQAVSRHLKKARWNAIRHAISVFEQIHKETI